MADPKLRPLTSRTRVGLSIARGLAAARGDRNLTATHVAAGILREGMSAAIAGLWYAGLSEMDIRALGFELERALGDPPGDIPPRQVTIDLTPGEGEVLGLADIEAGRLGDTYLGAEHILLGILRSNDAAAHLFAKRGITTEKYYDGLSSVRRGDSPPNQANAV